MKIRIFYILPLLIHFALSGCITLPENEDEIRQGIVESEQLKNVDSNDIRVSPTPFTSEELIGGQKTLEEFYKILKFNPNGESLRLVALKDPLGAFHAKSVKEETVVITSKLFPNLDAYDNEADAFRHAYFSFRLSQEIGESRAKRFTDAYEIHHINKMGSRCMDLWNNREGREMNSAIKNLTKFDKKILAESEVLKAIRMKKLALRPFQIKIEKNKNSE